MDMLPTSLEPVDGSPTQQISLIGSGQTERLEKEKEHYEIGKETAVAKNEINNGKEQKNNGRQNSHGGFD